MTFKDFIKLTKWKIILTIIIGLFVLFSFFMSGIGIICEKGDCYTLTNKIFLVIFIILVWPFLLMLGIEKLIFTEVDWIHAKDVPFLIIAAILTVLFWYLIACIIFCIFKKKRKK